MHLLGFFWAKKNSPLRLFMNGAYWIRTSDFHRVKMALYR